jgi:competence protein ComGC
MKKMITMMLVVFIVAALMILAVSCGSPNTSTAETKAAEQENEETAAAVETTAAVETKAAEAVTEAAGTVLLQQV